MHNKYIKKTRLKILLNYKIPHAIVIAILVLLAALQANSAETLSNNHLNSPDHINIPGLQDSVVFKGKIIDEKEKPIAGATISVKGTNKSVISNRDGLFTIAQINGSNTLIVKYVGFEAKEFKASEPYTVVTLKGLSTELNEVVIVAYGTAKKSSYVGSVSQIKSEELEDRQVSNISSALQGLAPGLQATSSSGQPGTTATIRIRGIGSINASSDPLYVVDGAPYQGDINAIDVNDIASVSILKDAASSALYGSRGANGVIIITTKEGGKFSETKINASLNRGFSNRAVNDYKQMSTDQYFESYWLALKNKQLTNGLTDAQASQSASTRLVAALGINPYGDKFPQPVGLNGKLVNGATPLWNDKWSDVLERNGQRTQANLSFTGGDQKNQYFISGGYLNDQGFALGSGFKRYNARVNLTSQAKKWLKVGLNISGNPLLMLSRIRQPTKMCPICFLAKTSKSHLYVKIQTENICFYNCILLYQKNLIKHNYQLIR